MNKKPRRKPVSELTVAELEAMTADLDREFVADGFGELTPQQKERWTRAKRRRGRPRQGAGAKPISVTIEKELLRQVDSFAKRRRVGRSQLIARGLQAIVNGELALK
jgi:hypothetical protein